MSPPLVQESGAEQALPKKVSRTIHPREGGSTPLITGGGGPSALEGLAECQGNDLVALQAVALRLQ